MKSAPRRLQTVTRSPCFQARTRKPSCLISCSQPGPAGGRFTSVGSHGRMNPGGVVRRQSEGAARQDTFFNPDLFCIMAGVHSGVVAVIPSKAAAVIMMPITDYSYKASGLILGLSSPLAAVRASWVERLALAPPEGAGGLP